MAIDGTYGFVYCGNHRLGIGIIRVFRGGFEGLDYVGGRYSGTAIEDPKTRRIRLRRTADPSRIAASGQIMVRLTFEVKPGMIRVQGTAPQDLPQRREIDQVLPPGFGDGRPIKIDASPGTVTVMVRRISDEYAARGMSVQMAPIPEPTPA
jgi:hypothetical protein